MKVIHDKEIKTITFLDERFYQSPDTGSWYPSNTTILDVYPKGYGYIQWLKDLGSNADQVMKRAGEQGTHIHDAIESYLKGKELIWKDDDKEEPNYTLEEWMMILKFVDFYNTYKPETIAIEAPLVSDTLGFGSRLDYICRLPAFPDDVWYIDWKSGGGIYKSHEIQASACQEIWNEKEEIKVTRTGLLHLDASTRGADKTGKTIQGLGWKLVEVQDQPKTYELFKHALAIWKEENPNPLPKNMIYPDRVSMEDIK
jgi:hypothetical protein